MSIPWELRRRGLKDSLRHDQRVKDAIRKNLRELIAEEAIITSDGKKRVKIPLRYLDQYRFKYSQPPSGVGRGAGQPGDVIGQQPGDGRPAQPGDQAGDQAGDHTYEVDVPLEDLTQMMLEDLALPWLEEKPERHITTTTHRYTDIRRKGSLANLDKRRTLLVNIKRNAARGKPALGNLNEADLRFRVWDAHEERQANAAVYMLMDCSGSMTTNKKYVAKSFFFWTAQFLRQKYHQVEAVFIAHDSEASIVSEEAFFALSTSGGTRCSSAYDVALAHMQQQHPAANWNTYLFHFSDGDNLPSDNAACKTLVERLLEHCTMVGYGEIRYGDDASFYGWTRPSSRMPSSLLGVLQEITHSRFLSTTIVQKDEIYQALKIFLQPREDIHV